MPIDFGKLRSLNGLEALVRQSGDYVDPLNSRAGIQGLGAFGVPTLTPGMHGMMVFPGSGGSVDDLSNPIHPNLSGLGCGNAVLDCACKREGGQADHGLALGLGAFSLSNLIPSTMDLSLTGSVLHGFGLPAVPNYVVYGALAYLLFMSGGGGGAHKR